MNQVRWWCRGVLQWERLAGVLALAAAVAALCGCPGRREPATPAAVPPPSPAPSRSGLVEALERRVSQCEADRGAAEARASAAAARVTELEGALRDAREKNRTLERQLEALKALDLEDR